MAQFYAHIQGSRGPASRLGCKASGMNVSVKSWQGEITVRMNVVKDGTDWVSVWLGPHSNDNPSGRAVCLYTGPCSGWQGYYEQGELGRMVWNIEHGRKVAA
jgi:hypothetical protein